MQSLLNRFPIQASAGIAVLLAMTALLTGLGWIGSQAVESTFCSQIESDQSVFLDHFADQLDAKLNISKAALEAVARQVTPPLYEDGDVAQSFLDAQVALHAIFDNGLYLIDNDGRIIAESPSLPEGRNRNISYREYFQIPTQTKQPYISRPYASKHAADRPAVTIVIPVFDNQGAMIGRLHGSFELRGSNFIGSLPETAFGRKGYIYLVDDNRTVIVHPDRNRILKEVPAPGVNQILDRGLEGFEGSGETVTSSGVHQLATTKWLKTVKWLLVSNYPMEELLQPVRQVRRQMILTGIVCTALTLSLLFLALGRVTKPLSLLTRRIEEMQGEGYPSFQPNAFGSIEVWKLAHSFGALFQRLSDRQARIRESEEKFRAIFECSPIAITINRMHDGVYLDVNPAYEAISGYAAAEVIGRQLSDFVHAADAAKSREIAESLLHEERVDNREAIGIRKNGTTTNIVYSAATFQKNDELYAVSAIIDITERKRAEEIIRTSEQKFRSIVENSSESIVLTNTGGAIIEWNRGAERSGILRDEALGRKLWDVIYTMMTPDRKTLERMNNLRKAMQRSLRTGELFQFAGNDHFHDLPLMHRNGQIRYIQWNLTAIPSKQGFMLLITTREMTERRRTEQALRKRKEELDALNQLSRAVTSKRLSLEAICQAAVDKVTEALLLDAAVLFLLKDSELCLMASGPQPSPLPVETTPTHRAGECLCGQAALKGQAIFCRNTKEDARCTWQECRNAGIHSFAAIPLRYDGNVLGVLGAGSIIDRDFEKSAHFLETAADHLAISIHNAKLFEETSQYAAQLQQFIAERELTQQVLKQNERRLSLAISATTDAIWEWNLITREAYYSPRWYEMLGYSDREFPMTIDSWKNLCHPDDYLLALERIKAFIAAPSAESYTVEFRMHAKDGAWIWILGRGNVMVKDEDGRPLQLIGTNTDITKRKKAELALQASESMLRSVFQAVPLGIAVTSASRMIESVNEGMVKMFGHGREEMIGRNARFLYFTDTEYEHVGSRLYRKNGAKDLSTEVRMRGKKDIEIQALLCASLLDPDNPDGGAVITVMDITHRKRMEEQLRLAQKSEALGQLAGGIAHDFNNILGGIIGFSELAMGQISENPNRAETCMQRVLQAGNRARELVGQILSFSRQEEPVFVQMKPAGIVREVLNLMKAVLPANIEIQHDMGADLPRVKADPSQLHQLVMNLCTNAYHAMRGSSGILAVSLDRCESGEPITCRNRDLPAGVYARLKVCDTGHGIDPANIERIFDPYFTTKEKGEGTGLGLSVTLGILDNHGGGIQVESIKNKGTTFSIYLPESAPQADTRMPVHAEMPTGTEHILFVDDESLFIEMGMDILTRLGYQVTCVQDSVEALDRFTRSPDHFDLVITDHSMPKMTGLELLQHLKRVRPGIPVIVCTGFSEDIQTENPPCSGISKVLYKPYSLIDIATAIREVLK